MRGHFRPFTGVLRRIWPFVTRKMQTNHGLRGITQMEIVEAPYRLRGMQTARLQLQLDHFGASEATIFSKRGSPRSGYRGSTLFRLVRAFSLAGGTRTGL